MSSIKLVCGEFHMDYHIFQTISHCVLHELQGFAMYTNVSCVCVEIVTIILDCLGL